MVVGMGRVTDCWAYLHITPSVRGRQSSTGSARAESEDEGRLDHGVPGAGRVDQQRSVKYRGSGSGVYVVSCFDRVFCLPSNDFLPSHFTFILNKSNRRVNLFYSAAPSVQTPHLGDLETLQYMRACGSHPRQLEKRELTIYSGHSI